MRRSIATMFCALLLVGACGGTKPQAPAFAPIAFTDQPVMRVNAPRIDIQEDFTSPLSPPHVEYEMPVRPIELVRSWARDRLRPVGTSGQFRIIVKDASVVAEKLQTKDGIRGALTTQQDTNLIAKIVVEVQYEQPGVGASSAMVNIYRTQTLAEDITMNDRDRAYYELAKQLAADLNAQLTTNINQSMRDALL